MYVNYLDPVTDQKKPAVWAATRSGVNMKVNWDDYSQYMEK